MATFVLVHGAWGGGWVWTDVAGRLRKAGHEVFTPTLTGLADRSHLLTRDVNLETHVTDVINVLKWERLSDVTLVGHSYAGMVISGVADRQHARIGSIVYFDAFVPETGTAMAGLLPTAGSLAATSTDGWTIPAPDSAQRWGIRDKAQAAWLDANATPHPLATMTQALPLAGNHLKIAKKGFLCAGLLETTPFRRFAEKFRADPGWNVVEWKTHHFAMVDMPAETTELLAGWAA